MNASFASIAAGEIRLDLRGLKCPLPVLRTRRALESMALGQVLVVVCTDPMARIDVPHLLSQTGDRLEHLMEADGVLTFTVRRNRSAS